MQSGRANLGEWVLEISRESASLPHELLGWSGSNDTKTQVKIKFDSLEQAQEYAAKNGISYVVNRPNERIIKPKAYADNFAFNRLKPWTH